MLRVRGTRLRDINCEGGGILSHGPDIAEWQCYNVGRDFAADMGIQGADIASKETFHKLQKTLLKVSPLTN